ncbi:MAG: hypothetical protein ACKKL6_02090 [Candidatus Komeilibacteria bacterium]
MDSLKDLLKLDEREEQPDKCQYPWQDLAKEIAESIPDTNKYKKRNAVFKVCKQNPSAAEAAFKDTKELGKMHILYFFKTFYEIDKRQKTGQDK